MFVKWELKIHQTGKTEELQTGSPESTGPELCWIKWRKRMENMYINEFSQLELNHILVSTAPYFLPNNITCIKHTVAATEQALKSADLWLSGQGDICKYCISSKIN